MKNFPCSPEQNILANVSPFLYKELRAKKNTGNGDVWGSLSSVLSLGNGPDTLETALVQSSLTLGQDGQLGDYQHSLMNLAPADLL